MLDTGLLVSLPTESIAVRVVVASMATVLLARLLLRSGLRVPAVRAVTALLPGMALACVVGLFWSQLHLPALWVPVDAVDALPVPVRDTYLTFAPLAAPILVAFWAAVASVRIALRVHRLLAARRTAARAFRDGAAPPQVVHGLVRRLAAQLHVVPPPVALVERCHGGATVVGLRRHLLVIDRELVARLDPDELEGVLAHELAHIKRRDNLVAVVFGVVRDLFFFVPGGRWGLRQLHAERELAADAHAASVTGRPAALASGLLKVVESSRTTAAGCAALAPSATLVDRVQHLIEDPAPVSRARSTAELAAAAAVVVVAVAAAVELPSVLAGEHGQRDALGVLWSAPPETARQEASSRPEARAFHVYRESGRIDQPAESVRRVPVIDDDADLVRPGVLRCGTPGYPTCPERLPSYSLGLRPKPVTRMDESLVDRWRIEPVVSVGREGLSLFWFQRVE